MNLNWAYPTDGLWWVVYTPQTITTDSTTSWTVGAERPSKWERQRERFRAQLARRRGRLLTLEVEGMLKW